MEFWYFLMLMSGGWLVMCGLFEEVTSRRKRFGTLIIWIFLIALELLMFQNESNVMMELGLKWRRVEPEQYGSTRLMFSWYFDSFKFIMIRIALQVN